MFFYGSIVAQILFSLNYDALFAYGTSRDQEGELRFGEAAMTFGIQWYLMLFTAIPILINSFFAVTSGVMTISSLLSQF
jgi:hypothetical protein